MKPERNTNDDLARRTCPGEPPGHRRPLPEDGSRAEEADLFRTLLERSLDGVYIYDSGTREILVSNQRFLRLIGYADGELEFRPLDGILVPVGEVIAENPVSDRGGPAGGWHCLYRHKDGSVVDTEAISTPVTYRGLPAFLVIVRDITERRIAEQELACRAVVMQDQAELLDVAEDAIMVRDLEERIIFWNRGAEERYGWTKEEALGRIAQELLHTESDRSFRALREELFEKGSLTEELMHVTRDGTRIIVESRWTIRRDKDGKPLAIMEINNDITKRKRAEKILRMAKEELELRVAERTAELQSANERLSLELERRNRIQKMLRKAAERYKDLFDNSPIGIYRTNPQGRILMANPSLLRMLGFAPSHTLASLTGEKGLYEPTYVRKRFVNQLHRKGKVRGFEASWKRHDGSKISVRENAKTVCSPEGSILYCEGTVEDISEQKKAEEDIQSYQQQLRSLAAELSLAEERERRRIATILHDHIGQILALAKIKLGVLIETPPSADGEGSIREIREFIDQAITYTRSLTFELSPPILYAFGLEAALEWLSEQMMEQYGIICDFENDNQDKPVSEEIRVFMFTAVRELLANVAKHAHASRAKVTTRRINRSIVIHVADDGVGFNPSKVKSHLYDNKGFGLFSIRERLRHLGGQMEVKSIKGRGTRVILEEPLALE